MTNENAMRLDQLDARFMKCVDPRIWRPVFSIDEADGLMFLCPLCFERNGGASGTHTIICWRPRVSVMVSPSPGRWEFEGAGLKNLTLVSSVEIPNGCGAHFWVRNGVVEPC